MVEPNFPPKPRNLRFDSRRDTTLGLKLDYWAIYFLLSVNRDDLGILIIRDKADKVDYGSFDKHR